MNIVQSILQWISTHIKLVLIGIGAFILLIIGLNAVTSYVPAGMVRLSIHVFPSDAILKLDGTEYKNNQEATVKIGTHAISVTRNGFLSYETASENITKDDTTLAYILQAQSPDAVTWSKNHQNEFDAVYTIIEKVSYDKNQRYLSKYPIAGLLPYDGKVFTVGSLQGSDPVVLTVQTYSGYRNAAVRKLSNLSYDPADYTIRFNDYTNPFEGSAQ